MVRQIFRQKLDLVLLFVLLASGCAPGNIARTDEETETAQVSESNQMDVTWIDDFEGDPTGWLAGQPPDYSDSSAVDVILSNNHASSGKGSLELVFDLSELPKAIFYLERQIDLSSGGFLEFELYNPGIAQGVALSLSTGTTWEWYESELIPLDEGENTVSFELLAGNYKSAASGWQPSTFIDDLELTQRIAVLLAPRQAGSVWIDALRVSSQASGRLPDMSARPSPTSRLPRVPSRVELRAPSEVKREYELVEFEVVTDGVYANPFDPAEVELQVLFSSPDGGQSLVPAFWHQEYDLDSRLPSGEPGWRVRFTPVGAGEWSAQAFLGSMLRSDIQPLTSEVVYFHVGPVEEVQGFVRLHPTNPGYLAFESGETFYPLGINMGWGSADQLSDYERWLDGFSANGGNLIRIWMASWSFGLEWNDTGLGDYTNRLYQAWMLDQVFRMAEQRGVYIELVLINHGAFSATVNPQWHENPYNAANGGPCQSPEDFATDEQARGYFKRRLRYTAARWAYSPALLAWEWWNEAEWTPISNSQMRAWIEEMTPVLQSNDPYDHLISTSYAHASTPEVNGMGQIDFSQVHLYSQSDPALEHPDILADWIEDVPGKPVLFGEFGASAGGEDARSDDRQGLHLHNALWASTFSGYASTAMYWWWDSYVDPLGLWKVFGRLDRFLEGEDLAALGPARGVLSSREVPYLIRMNERRVLVWLHDRAYELNTLQRIRAMSVLQGEPQADDWEYLPDPVNGLTLKLIGLRDGEYKAYWYSPNQGEWLQSDDLQVVSGEGILLVPGFQGDLAVKVLPAGESGPPVP